MLGVLSAPALAHEGEPLRPHDLWTSWVLDPFIVLPLLLGGWLYVRGVRALWRSAGRGRGVRRWEAASFGAGMLTLALALVSPLHPMGEVLFSAHMVQHELLMALAAPLLVLGRPVVAFLWAVPQSWRRRGGGWSRVPWARASWRWLTAAPVAWSVHAVALWAWHLPGPYQATLASELAHALQHATFLAAALLFWWALLRRRESGLGAGAAVLYLFTTAVHTGALGALLTFSGVLWYPVYAATTAPWGLSALEDQQLAGLIMWVPASLAYLVAALALLAGWMRASEERVVRLERSDARRAFPAARAPLLALLACAFLLSACDEDVERLDAAALTGGDPKRGEAAIVRYGCAGCHTIPGIPGANGLVGPPLAGIGARVYVAGVLPNTPENLVRWIQNPRAVDSLTAMPDLGVNVLDARDIAAYLYTLR